MPDFNRLGLNRDPVVVFWEVTLACALACRHCRAEAQPRRHPLELSTKECHRVLDDLATFDRPPIVVLSGGDPFMRRDLFDIVEYGIGKELTMSVSPSATALLTRERLRRLNDLGVSRISLSLDGSTAAIHDDFRGVAGSFDRTMDGMKYAAEVGLSFQVNTTVSRPSLHDLPAIADLLKSTSVAVWDVFFLVPTGRASAEDVITADEHEGVFSRLYDLSKDAPYQVKTTLGQHYRRYQVLRRLEGRSLNGLGAEDISALYPGVPSNDGKGILFISHLGEVYPSGFLPLSVGNVNRRSVVKMYRDSDLFRKLRDPSQLGGKCGRCPFNMICGGCRARAYADSGDPLGEEPYCAYQPA
ncbi:MAG: TIGR04053 family radical SAM/SPASM domain-containing protein [Chloroflexi bacterium]|nr:TIGR04053 family radical SAM/SPASM domain-containing protein [Chloroflexota bacterium]